MKQRPKRAPRPKRQREPAFDPPAWANADGVVFAEASEAGFVDVEDDDDDAGEAIAAGFRSGTVALIGRPNAGKSTFLNQLLGQKIAATTHKPQTTRRNLLGILHLPGAQLLLLDTPGYHRAKGPLNRFMVSEARTAIRDADVVALIVEARGDGAITPGNVALIEEVRRAKKRVVLLVNKIDRLKDKSLLLPFLEAYQQALGEQLAAAVPISAMNKNGLDRAADALAAQLPAGPAYFDTTAITDQPEREIVAELIREKTILETGQELPYATAVVIEAFEDRRPRLVRIEATLYVERESQKPIVIGRGGARLKAIGQRARKDIEHFLGSAVYLGLHVKVAEGWSDDPRALFELGYSRRADRDRGRRAEVEVEDEQGPVVFDAEVQEDGEDDGE
jgi:GTP-binding protein Era